MAINTGAAFPLRTTDLRLATATTTFDGQAGSGATGTVGIFDITGDVMLWGFAVKCTTDLVDTVDGAVLDIGITDAPDILLDGSGAFLDLDTIDAGTWLDLDGGAAQAGWTRATDGYGFTMLPAAISSANFLYTIATQAITGGVLVAYALWSPLSADGNLVAS